MKRTYCTRIQGTIKIEREAQHGERCTAPHIIYTPTATPSEAKLEKWIDDGVALALDGCHVEPDGTCPHGLPSWLLRLGII